jgi:hypothetical protein
MLADRDEADKGSYGTKTVWRPEDAAKAPIVTSPYGTIMPRQYEDIAI